jgi:FtsH-binding integral membrane protein
MWQDFVIMSISILFTVMLIPQLIDCIRGRAKTNKLTAISTGTGLVIMGICYCTLGLYLSFLFSVVTGITWYLLAISWR